MDYKSIIAFEVKKENRTYTFWMPHGAPIGEAYDAAHSFLESITQKARDAAEQAKPKDITEITMEAQHGN